MCVSCNSGKNKQTDHNNEPKAVENIKIEDVKSKTFDQLFVSINPTDIDESVFKLVGSDYTVITSGDALDFNSMVASWGGWGLLFNKPTTWCFLRANRYTLEYIKKTHTYTMTYFDEPYKEQVLFFGSKTGKGTDKMKESSLTSVATPSGNMSYKEAKLIIECKLTEITTVSPDDFFTQEGTDFVTEAYKEAKEYHKLVFGEIVNVWSKK